MPRGIVRACVGESQSRLGSQASTSVSIRVSVPCVLWQLLRWKSHRCRLPTHSQTHSSGTVNPCCAGAGLSSEKPEGPPRGQKSAPCVTGLPALPRLTEQRHRCVFMQVFMCVFENHTPERTSDLRATPASSIVHAWSPSVHARFVLSSAPASGARMCVDPFLLPRLWTTCRVQIRCGEVMYRYDTEFQAHLGRVRRGHLG